MLGEVAKIMLEHRIACLPVVDDKGMIVGVVTESDFAPKGKRWPFTSILLPHLFGEFLDQGEVDPIYQAARKITAGEIMHQRVVTVTEDELVRTVLEHTLHHRINHVPVVKDGVPVGMVARHDLLKLMQEEESKKDSLRNEK
jgi:CBS domain-containing protein